MELNIGACILDLFNDDYCILSDIDSYISRVNDINIKNIINTTNINNIINIIDDIDNKDKKNEYRKKAIKKYLEKRKRRNWNNKYIHKCRSEFANRRPRYKGKFLSKFYTHDMFK